MGCGDARRREAGEGQTELGEGGSGWSERGTLARGGDKAGRPCAWEGARDSSRRQREAGGEGESQVDCGWRVGHLARQARCCISCAALAASVSRLAGFYQTDWLSWSRLRHATRLSALTRPDPHPTQPDPI